MKCGCSCLQGNSLLWLSYTQYHKKHHHLSGSEALTFEQYLLSTYKTLQKLTKGISLIDGLWAPNECEIWTEPLRYNLHINNTPLHLIYL